MGCYDYRRRMVTPTVFINDWLGKLVKILYNIDEGKFHSEFHFKTWKLCVYYDLRSIVDLDGALEATKKIMDEDDTYNPYVLGLPYNSLILLRSFIDYYKVSVKIKRRIAKKSPLLIITFTQDSLSIVENLHLLDSALHISYLSDDRLEIRRRIYGLNMDIESIGSAMNLYSQGMIDGFVSNAKWFNNFFEIMNFLSDFYDWVSPNVDKAYGEIVLTLGGKRYR